MALFSPLTGAEDIYCLLMQIAEAAENKDLKVELRKTASGTRNASLGGGVGGLLGAAAGALLFGPVGAVAGAALGAAACTSAAVQGTDLKSIPEILSGASREDKGRLAEAAKRVSVEISIRLTMGLVVPRVTEEARLLLVQVMRTLGYSLPKVMEE